MADYILETKGLDKWFGVTHANKQVDFQLRRGEIRGLIGENGSGKSTLTSIICGIQKPTSGEMFVNGVPYAPASVCEANQNKVAMVVQELGVLTDLPVCVNIYMGRTEEFSTGGMLSMKRLWEAAQKDLDALGLGEIPVNAMAGTLSIEYRKLVELTKALSIDPDILVLDEITQALSYDKRQLLYQIMKDFIAKGKSIIMISHDLEETLELCDSITILRDGEIVDTVQKDAFDLETLKHQMIGREMGEHYYRTDWKASYQDDVVLRVEQMSSGKLEELSFELHRGEILGVCGLSDAGIHQLGKALFGKEKISKGGVYLHGKGGWKKVTAPAHITKNRGAYLSKDRDAEGLMLSDSIAANITLPSEGDIAGPLAFVSPRKKREIVEKAVEKFEIKCASPLAKVNSLSGGNKQKVNLSRWMVKDLDFIILDCPTRGVDVGVKAYIYGLLETVKKAGLAILLISDELPEVIGMSDRLLVMKDGRISAILERDSGFAEDEIVEAMM